MKKEIDIGVHIRNELTEYGVEDSKIAEIVKIIEREEPKEPSFDTYKEYALFNALKPAPETVRLWCAKDYEPYYKKGDILLEAAEHFGQLYIKEEDKDKSYKRFYSDPKYLFPLLHRPAKEGEWVRCIKTCEIYCVAALSNPVGWIAVPLKQYNGNVIIPPISYDVIENYHGEYEQPEELLQGAAVMTGNDPALIKGKKYMFVDGKVKDEEGRLRPLNCKPVRTFDDKWVVNTGFIRLIED